MSLTANFCAAMFVNQSGLIEKRSDVFSWWESEWREEKGFRRASTPTFRAAGPCGFASSTSRSKPKYVELFPTQLMYWYWKVSFALSFLPFGSVDSLSTRLREEEIPNLFSLLFSSLRSTSAVSPCEFRFVFFVNENILVEAHRFDVERHARIPLRRLSTNRMTNKTRHKPTSLFSPIR